MKASSIARQLVPVLTLPLLLSCGGDGSSQDNLSASDSLAPQVRLTAPERLADDLRGTVALGATASDNIAVTEVEFEVDALALASDASAPFTASVNTADYASGQHIVRARARDAAGNVSAWATATVRFGGNQSVPAGFTKNERFITGLNRATALAQARDARLFIAEQGGAVRCAWSRPQSCCPSLSCSWRWTPRESAG